MHAWPSLVLMLGLASAGWASTAHGAVSDTRTIWLCMLINAFWALGGQMALRTGRGMFLAVAAPPAVLALASFAGGPWALAAVTAAAGALAFAHRRRPGTRWRDALAMTGACALTAAIVLPLIMSTWFTGGFPFADPTRMAASLTPDNIFHAAVAAMIKTNGLPSTGVHGDPILAYHVLSHAMFARFAVLADCSVPALYCAAYPIVLLPIMVATVACVALRVEDRSSWWRGPAAVAICGMLVAGVLDQRRAPGSTGWSNGIWDSAFRSQSYTLSIALSAAMLGDMVGRVGSGSVLVTAIDIPTIVMSKASTGLVMLASWAAAAPTTLRSRRERLVFAGLAIAGAASFLALAVPFLVRQSLPLNAGLFDFAKEHCGVPDLPASDTRTWLPILRFLAIHNVYSLIAISAAAVALRLGAQTRVMRMLIAANAAAATVGIAVHAFTYSRGPGALLGGAAVYFSNPAIWIAIPTTAIAVTSVAGLPGRAARAVAACSIAAIVGLFASAGWGNISAAYQQATQVARLKTPADGSGVVRLLELRGQYPEYLVHVRHADPAYRGFMFRGSAVGANWPFLVPALSEHAGAFVLPVREDIEIDFIHLYLGYHAYPRELFPSLGAPERSDAELMAFAARTGAAGVVVVEPDGRTRVVTRSAPSVGTNDPRTGP
jgi:hypothetical protein